MSEKSIDKDNLALSQLRQMEVIEISEGKRLGFISDIEFDDDLNCIESFIIPSQGSFFSFLKKKDDIKIKWNQIKVIGIDIILVDVNDKNANDI